MGKEKAVATRIGAHGRRIIEALESGKAVRRGAGGEWSSGALRAPQSLIDDLVRQDLVRVEGATLALAPAGIGFTVRNNRPEGANRLLAERALPRDGEERGARETARPRPRSVTVNLAESPLGWLAARGIVSERQHAAGERLMADWTIAGLAPRVTMRWDPTVTARGGRGPAAAADRTLAQMAAKRRFDAAMDAAGPGLRDIAWRVACAGEGLETAEKALGWPRRAGKLVLLLALDRVADAYGIGAGG